MLFACVARDFKAEKKISMSIDLQVNISFSATKKLTVFFKSVLFDILGTYIEIRVATINPKSAVKANDFGLKYSIKKEEITGPKEKPNVPKAKNILIFFVKSFGEE